MFIDSHCHLNFRDFREDADEVIKRTLRGGVQFINIGSQYSTSRRAVKYAEKYNKDGQNGVWAAVGIHPVHLFNSSGSGDDDFPNKISLEKFDYNKYLELAKNDRVVAIGEVGLDYHHFDTANLSTQDGSALGRRTDYKSTNDESRSTESDIDDTKNKENIFEKQKEDVAVIIKEQKRVFREFIKLANEVNKPIIIHGWNADKKDKELVAGAVAYEDILEIVRSPQSIEKSNNLLGEIDIANRELITEDQLKGVVHSFIGNYKIALRFIEEGFLIGLNGIITYSESYDRLIKEIGLKNIIIETDAPYLTPKPLKRYSRNEPLNVKLVAQKIADVLKMNIAQVEKITTKNAKQLFKI